MGGNRPFKSCYVFNCYNYILCGDVFCLYVFLVGIMKWCSCIESDPGLAEFVEIVFFAGLHGVTMQGPPFSFCPFCGSDLEDV